MGTHPAALCLVIALSNVLLVVGAPASSGTTNIFNNGQVGGVLFGSSSFFISSTTINNGKDKCSQTLYVTGQGVDDSFPLSCGTSNGVTSISGESYALYENPEEDFAFFTDTPSTLVVIQKDKCTRRSYKTSLGKTTHSEESMNAKECKEVKEKIEEKKEENRKYWEQWQKDFDEQMKKKYPPCYPFCDKKKPSKPVHDDDTVKSSQEDEFSEENEPEDSSSYEITETDKTSPEYWRQWQKKFDANMRKKYPPCFPFCDKKKPSKPNKSGKKDKPLKSGTKSSDVEDDEDTVGDDWNF